MPLPEIFDRDTHPLDASWLLTASFYEPRNKPADHETEAHGTAQAGEFIQLHDSEVGE